MIANVSRAPSLPRAGSLAAAAAAIALGAQLGMLVLVLPSPAPAAFAASVPSRSAVVSQGFGIGPEAPAAVPAPPARSPQSAPAELRVTETVVQTAAQPALAPELARILGTRPMTPPAAATAAVPAAAEEAQAGLAPDMDWGPAASRQPQHDSELAEGPERAPKPTVAPGLGPVGPSLADRNAARPVPGTVLAEPAAPVPAAASEPVATPARPQLPSLASAEPEVPLTEALPVTAAAKLPEDAAGEPAANWMAEADPRAWTVQLAATRSRADLLQLAAHHGLPATRTLVIETERSGRPWYALVYGAYPSFDSAAAVGRELGGRLGEGEAWIRRVAEVRTAARSLEPVGVAEAAASETGAAPPPSAERRE